jgi:arginine/lysine/histidine transporter system substrate-binding protein
MKKILKAVSIVAILSMAAIFPTGCSKDSSKLTVATNAEFEPFEYMDGSKIVGIDVDIVNEIAKDMGKTPDIQNMAFDSVVTAAAAGKTDLGVAGITKTAEREKSVDFSDPYYDAQNVVIVKTANTSVMDKDSLKGKKIAVQKGTTGDVLATGITGDSNVERFDATADAVTELKNGKVEAVIIDSFPAQKIIKQNTDLKLSGESFSSEQYCIAIKKGNKTLLNEVNKEIKKMKDNGDLDKIIKKYE